MSKHVARERGRWRCDVSQWIGLLEGLDGRSVVSTLQNVAGREISQTRANIAKYHVICCDENVVMVSTLILLSSGCDEVRCNENGGLVKFVHYVHDSTTHAGAPTSGPKSSSQNMAMSRIDSRESV